MQAAEQAQVEQEAKLIAFDRQNHMGISSKTAKRIEDTIAAEAAMMHDAKGVKAAVNIKENEERMKQLKVSRQSAWQLDILCCHGVLLYAQTAASMQLVMTCVPSSGNDGHLRRNRSSADTSSH